MNQQKKSLQVGLLAISAAVLLRFFSFVGPQALEDLVSQPKVAAFLYYMETGEKVRLSPVQPTEVPAVEACFPEPELPRPVQSPPPIPPPLPHFTDADSLELTYFCTSRPELKPLLSSSLYWDLASGAPTVLIFHTHTTESYEKGEQDYIESAPYRTTDDRYNVLAVGDRITALLNQAGIVTLHDREYHDYPDYNGCYGRTRKCTAAYLKEYPGLRLVLDLHRDASEGGPGQLRTLAKVDGQDSAQLMIVAGSQDSGAVHPLWLQNLSLGLKLQAQLQSQCPGIVRPLSLRAQRFNQDLSPGSLIIEVGGAGNTLQEAMLAGDQLARAIIALSQGTGPREPPSDS